jgi:hypothetical protein
LRSRHSHAPYGGARSTGSQKARCPLYRPAALDGARGRLRRLVWCGHFIDGAEKGGAIERAASSGWHQIISNAVQTLGAPKSIVLVGRELEDHQRVEHEANGLSSVTASTLASESDEHVERQCRNPLSGSCRAKLHPASHRASAVYEKRTGSI